MTLVAGYVGLNGILMVSDSRTYQTPAGHRYYCDHGQKLFALNGHIAVGYASEDVRVTWEIVQRVAAEMSRYGDFENLYAAKDKLIGVTKKVSAEVYSSMQQKPRTYLMFGILQPNRARMMSKQAFHKYLMRRGGGSIPGQIIRGLSEANGPKYHQFNTGYPMGLVVASYRTAPLGTETVSAVWPLGVVGSSRNQFRRNRLWMP